LRWWITILLGEIHMKEGSVQKKVDFIEYIEKVRKGVKDKDMQQHAEVFATDLKQIQLKLLSQTSTEEIQKDYIKGFSGQENYAYSKIIALSDTLSEMIAADILLCNSKEEMKRVYAFYIEVAEKSFKNSDFQSAMIISSALTSGSLDRLKILGEMPKIATRIEKIPNKFNELRRKTQSPFPPFALGNVPYFPVVPQSLIPLKQGLENAKEKLIKEKSENGNDIGKLEETIKEDEVKLGVIINTMDSYIKNAKSEPMKSNLLQKLARPTLINDKIFNNAESEVPIPGSIQARSYSIKPIGVNDLKFEKPEFEFSEQVKQLSNFNEKVERLDPKNPVHTLLRGWKHEAKDENDKLSTEMYKFYATDLHEYQTPIEIMDSISSLLKATKDEKQKEIILHNAKLFVAELIKADPLQTRYKELNDYLVSKNPPEFNKTDPNSLVGKFVAIVGSKENESNMIKNGKEALKKAAWNAANIVVENAKIDPEKILKGEAEGKFNLGSYLQEDLSQGKVRGPKDKQFAENAKLITQDLKHHSMALMLKVNSTEFNKESFASTKEKNWHKAENLREMMMQFEQIKHMILTDIMKGTSRSHQQNIYNFYTKVFNGLVESGDYFTAYAIKSAFDAGPLLALQKGYLEQGVKLSMPTEYEKFNKNNEIFSPQLGFKALIENQEKNGLTTDVSVLISRIMGFESTDEFNIEKPSYDRLEIMGKILSGFQKFQNRAKEYLKQEQVNCYSNVGVRLKNLSYSENKLYAMKGKIYPDEKNSKSIFSDKKITLESQNEFDKNYIKEELVNKKSDVDELVKDLNRAKFDNKESGEIDAKTNIALKGIKMYGYVVMTAKNIGLLGDGFTLSTEEKDLIKLIDKVKRPNDNKIKVIKIDEDEPRNYNEMVLNEIPLEEEKSEKHTIPKINIPKLPEKQDTNFVETPRINIGVNLKLMKINDKGEKELATPRKKVADLKILSNLYKLKEFCKTKVNDYKNGKEVDLRKLLKTITAYGKGSKIYRKGLENLVKDKYPNRYKNHMKIITQSDNEMEKIKQTLKDKVIEVKQKERVSELEKLGKKELKEKEMLPNRNPRPTRPIKIPLSEEKKNVNTITSTISEKQLFQKLERAENNLKSRVIEKNPTDLGVPPVFTSNFKLHLQNQQNQDKNKNPEQQPQAKQNINKPKRDN